MLTPIEEQILQAKQIAKGEQRSQHETHLNVRFRGKWTNFYEVGSDGRYLYTRVGREIPKVWIRLYDGHTLQSDNMEILSKLHEPKDRDILLKLLQARREVPQSMDKKLAYESLFRFNTRTNTLCFYYAAQNVVYPMNKLGWLVLRQ